MLFEKRNFRIKLSFLFSSFILFSIVASGIWIELAHIKLIGFLFLFCLLYWLGKTKNPDLNRKIGMDFHWPSPWTWENTVSGLVTVLPCVVYLGLTLFQEFPFAGDQPFHLQVGRQVALFNALHLIPVALLILLCFKVSQKVRSLEGLAPLLVVACAFLWSCFTIPHEFFARYPGVGYFINTPFVFIGKLISQLAFISANRVTNILCVFTWVFVLRPLFLKRLPDFSVLPFVAFFFYQQLHIYYFTSYYLEPWGMVFLFLAVENLSTDKKLPEWSGVLLCGFATIIKEQALLMIPFVWLVSFWKTRKRLLPVVSLIVSVTPYFLYHLFRKEMQIWRNWQPFSVEDIFSSVRIQAFYERLYAQFEPSGLVLLAIILLLSVFYVSKHRNRRWDFLIFFAGCISQIFFFYIDRVSADYPAYPRYLLMPLLFFCAVLFSLGREKRVSIPLFLLLLVLNGIPLGKFFADTRGPDSVRNFIDHLDAPQFFPIRKLVGRAKKEGRLDGIKKIVTLMPDYLSFAPYYPELDKSYEYSIQNMHEPTLVDCRCIGGEQAVIYLPVYYTHLGRSLNTDPNDAEMVRQSKELCIETIQKTCTTQLTERVGDTVTGIFAF